MNGPGLRGRVKTDLPQGVKIAVLGSVCLHLIGDGVAAVRDGLLFVAVADLFAFGVVVVLAYELRKARGHL